MSRQLPWSNTPQAQPLSERKAVQPYQYSVATDGYFVPNRSTYYWGSPSDMVFNSQPTHQGMSPETWNTSKSARNELYQHRPPHPQHFLPYYAHSWKQNEPTPATTVQMHGYAALTQQPTQAPLAGTEVESDHCGRSHPTAATNATTSSWRQPANTSRSRRTSRTTYAHNSPGPPKASPVQRLSDASGKEIMRFEYTMNRKKTQVELRCDIEHIDIASLSAAFKRDHACYKDAGDGNIDEAIIRARMYERGKTEGKMRTRFRRMKYEADCNRIGWRLVMLNAEKLAGHKGMIQRAADSYRNSSSDLDKRSRRLNREITKARRRAAVEEASRHESIGPITEEHFSVSPTDHAAQSPQSLAFPSHQSYGSGYGFGPGNSGKSLSVKTPLVSVVE